jgi:hypothetical protein
MTRAEGEGSPSTCHSDRADDHFILPTLFIVLLGGDHQCHGYDE